MYTLCKDSSGYWYVRLGQLDIPDCSISSVEINGCFTLCNAFPKAVPSDPGTAKDAARIAEATVAPNPAHGKTNIALNTTQTGTYTLSVLNLKAQQLLRYQQTIQKAGQIEFTINTASLPDGTYLYQIQNGDSKRIAAGTFVVIH